MLRTSKTELKNYLTDSNTLYPNKIEHNLTLLIPNTDDTNVVLLIEYEQHKFNETLSQLNTNSNNT